MISTKSGKGGIPLSDNKSTKWKRHEQIFYKKISGKLTHL